MINLIKNEFIKIIKKKGFLIMILVMIGYALLTNVIYKSLTTILESDEFYSELTKNNYDLNNRDDLSAYVSVKTDNDIYKLKEKYGKKSWQAGYLNKSTSNEIIYEINSYENKLSKDKEAYDAAKRKYNELIKKLDTGDWRSIANEDKKKLETELKTLKETPDISNIQIEYLKYDIEELKIRLDKNISYEQTYQNTNLSNYIAAQKELLDYKNSNLDNLSKTELNNYQTQRELMLSSKYALEHNYDITSFDSSYSIIKNFFNEYLLMIIIMVFMIAGGICSQEFSKGTIKMLLVKPYSRIKILASKYITTLLSIIMAFVIMLIIQLLVGGLFFGFDSLKQAILNYNVINDSLEVINIFQYILMMFVSVLPCLILLGTLAFAISAIFANTSVAIILGFVGFIGGDILNSMLSNTNLWFKKFIVTFNWDLSPYFFNKAPIINNLNLGFSITMCLIYLIIMLIPTFIIFKKKDISNI